jgi:hypothetical protein
MYTLKFKYISEIWVWLVDIVLRDLKSAFFDRIKKKGNCPTYLCDDFNG